MGDYRELRVWKRAHALTLEVYRATAGYPSAELYGLISQTRRAAGSIPTNLAEGCGRNTDKELRFFCRVALGSASELEYHLLLARDLGHLNEVAYQQLTSEADQIKRMLASLGKRLQTH